jgi:hypothetical protein
MLGVLPQIAMCASPLWLRVLPNPEALRNPPRHFSGLRTAVITSKLSGSTLRSISELDPQ